MHVVSIRPSTALGGIGGRVCYLESPATRIRTYVNTAGFAKGNPDDIERLKQFLVSGIEVAQSNSHGEVYVCPRYKADWSEIEPRLRRAIEELEPLS